MDFYKFDETLRKETEKTIKTLIRVFTASLPGNPELHVYYRSGMVTVKVITEDNNSPTHIIRSMTSLLQTNQRKHKRVPPSTPLKIEIITKYESYI